VRKSKKKIVVTIYRKVSSKLRVINRPAPKGEGKGCAHCCSNRSTLNCNDDYLVVLRGSRLTSTTTFRDESAEDNAMLLSGK
jgi:hypothetical protein